MRPRRKGELSNHFPVRAALSGVIFLHIRTVPPAQHKIIALKRNSFLATYTEVVLSVCARVHRGFDC